MDVQIFVMTHKPFTSPPDTMYVPLQVGRACHEPLGYLGDDTGQQISDQNAYYSELTGVYWLWRNLPHIDVIGVCHYRRYFIAEDQHLYTKADIKRLLTNYDMIVTKKLELRMPYYDGFSITHDQKDLIATEHVVAEKYPDYAPLFHRMVHDKYTYFANMMICPKMIYDAYCSWLFDILFEVQHRIDTTGYDHYRKRVFGFLSEFLLTVWIEKNKIKVYESNVGMSAEKQETAEIKKRLSHYFTACDIPGAKQYFLNELEKRPDVLMEASDIKGELKLCMQIISTCEYEKIRQEPMLVERGLTFFELLEQVRTLNQFTQQLDYPLREEQARQIHAYLQTHPVSLTAVEIAGIVLGRKAGWMSCAP